MAIQVRASQPLQNNLNPLGVLADLPGKWVGPGFNLVALPIFDKSTRKFQLKLNATTETLKFDSDVGRVPNRGNEQPDIDLFGVRYLQDISDAHGAGALHLEPGFWLTVPKTSAPPAPATIVRLATIPHGDSVLAQGDGFEVDGGPVIDVADSTPFTLNPDGSRQNDTSRAYLQQYNDPSLLPLGITLEDVANPNLLLTKAIAAQKIVRTVVLRVNATPVGGIEGNPPLPNPMDVGGIVNIPFVVKNANANAMSAIFWIETVQQPDGTHFLQLQYTQTVILDFPVPGPDGTPIDIKWPHISVATLIKH